MESSCTPATGHTPSHRLCSVPGLPWSPGQSAVGPVLGTASLEARTRKKTDLSTGEGVQSISSHSLTLKCWYLVRRPLIGLLYQSRMTDDYGTFGRTRIGRRNGRIRRKPIPVPLFPPQIPNDLTCDRTHAAAESRRLTSSRPSCPLKVYVSK
jgi:hypothetical protein